MTFYYDILKAVLAAEGLKAYKVNKSTSCECRLAAADFP